MNYLIDPKIFYYMSVVRSFEGLIIFVGIAFVVTLVIGVAIYLWNKKDISRLPSSLSGDELKTCEKLEKMFKPKLFAIAFIVLFTIPIFIPSHDTMMKMIIASQVTTENIESVQKSATELIDYIVDKIDEVNE